MVNMLGQIMLYVNNQDEVVAFWTEKIGFSVISEEDNGQGMRWVEIAPTNDVETSIIFHNKGFISKMSPELNLGTPSLMFFSKDVDKLYKDLSNKSVKVGKIIDIPSSRVFNFAVMQKK